MCRRGLPCAVALLAVLVLFAGCAAVPSPATPTPPAGDSPPADGVRVTVVEVVDGDTIEIRYRNGTRDTARLIGIDTPEVHAENEPEEFEGVPSTTAGRACLERWGERASGVTTRLLLGETVTISFDVNEPRRGYYGRLLVYVHHEDRSVNLLLVERGLARVYDSSFQYRERYYAVEERAMAAERGLWTCRTPASTGTWTATPADSTTTTGTSTGEGVVVSGIHADADGPDGENLNGEYVVVRNRGDAAVSLAGWTLADAAGHEYVFPDGFALGPGESVRVHVGAGTDTATDLYWGRDSPTLNNDGETATLRDADGTVVARRST